MTTVLQTPQFPFDPTGVNPANRVTGELQPLTGAGDRDFYYVVPISGPYFGTSLQLSFKSLQGELRPLVEGIDYVMTHYFLGASRACGKPIYGSITFLNKQLRGTLIFNSYQSLGGEWTVDTNTIARILAESMVNPRTVGWDQVAGYPNIFPPIPHEWNLQDMVGQSAMVAAIDRIVDAVLTQASSAMVAHMAATGNVHHLSCGDIGAVSRLELNLAVQEAFQNTTFNTDGVAEGNNNHYFTEARAVAAHLVDYLVTQDVNPLGESDTVVGALAKLQAQSTAKTTLINAKANAARPQFTGLGSQNLVTIDMPGSITIDLVQAEAYQVNVKGSGFINFDTSNVGNMTNKVVEFSITTVNDNSGNGYAIGWPANVRWVDGAPPPRTTTANARDLWYFVSEDNMVTWTGSLSNLNPR